MNLDAIPSDIIIARGQYATVRSAHEDEKKRLQVLCGALSATSAQILRGMQPDNDGDPDMVDVNAKISQCRKLVDDIAVCASTVSDLAEQRAALKPAAWGGK